LFRPFGLLLTTTSTLFGFPKHISILSIHDEGYYVHDEGYYVPDEGYYVPDGGYYVPDEGYFERT
jgi:hypothetical protein